MTTATLISVDEYLHTSYRPDCDYVDGEVQERNLGEKDHGRLQREILIYLPLNFPALRERTFPEQRVQVTETRFRVPDVCIVREEAVIEQIVTTPPILCIEILSPEDRMSRYLERMNDYFQMGVPVCWIIDPVARSAWIATPGLLVEAQDGVLQAGEIEIPLAEILP